LVFVHSQKPAAGVYASAHAVRTIDGRVLENIRHLHGEQERARVRQFPDARRTRRSASAGIRLFHGGTRRREHGEV